MGDDAWEQIEGTCLVVGAALVFALVALVVQRDPLPVLVATECRFLVSWIVAIVFMLVFRKSRGLQWFGPRDLRKWLVLKCACSFVFITLWWAALERAPIGDCIAIIYSSPILVSLLSRVFLKEALPREFPAQVVLVSIGTILVMDPPFVHALFASDPGDVSQHGDYTFVFLALGACAIVPIVTRKAKDCSWIEVEHVSACLASAILNPSLLFGQYLIYGTVPQLPTAAPGEIGLIMVAAAGSFVGIAMETKGYQLAEVGKASMFRYLELPFGYLLQCVGTNAPVHKQAVLGAVFILLSCILGLKETTKAREAKKQQGDDEKKQSLLET